MRELDGELRLAGTFRMRSRASQRHFNLPVLPRIAIRGFALRVFAMAKKRDAKAESKQQRWG